MFRPTGWIYALPLSNIDYGQTLSLNNRYYALGLFTNFIHRMTISCMHYGTDNLIYSSLCLFTILPIMHLISLFEVGFLKAFSSDQISHVIFGFISINIINKIREYFFYNNILDELLIFLVKTEFVTWTSMNYTKRLHHRVFCIFFQWKKKCSFHVISLKRVGECPLKNTTLHNVSARAAIGNPLWSQWAQLYFDNCHVYLSK